MWKKKNTFKNWLVKGLIVVLLLLTGAFLLAGTFDAHKSKISVSYHTADKVFLYGDLNDDKTVDLRDATIGLRYLVGGGIDSSVTRRLGLSEIIYILQMRAGLRGYTAVSGGGRHTLALHGNGTVRTWGSNGFGQLGDGEESVLPGRETPETVSGLSNIVAVATGYEHSLALQKNGILWAWGSNLHYELGDGTTTDRFAATMVTGIDGVVAIAAGIYHSVALRSDGTVWTWGDNHYGQLGYDNVSKSKHEYLSVPSQVASLDNVKAIASGGFHTVALKSDGTVWTWGDNQFGQLGHTSTDDLTNFKPKQVDGLNNIKAVASGKNHVIAVKEDGTVWTWGFNDSGQLGYCTATDDCFKSSYAPTQVKLSNGNPLTGIKAAAGGGYHTVALKEDGTVWTWGYNEDGELGNGTLVDRNIPSQLYGIDKIVFVAAGMYHTAVLRYDGTLRTWGYNGYGQLGDGTYTNRNKPTQVSNP